MKRRRGVALIVVLWTVTLLSVMGGSLLTIANVERRHHAMVHDQTKAEYLGRAALVDLGTGALEYFGLPQDQRPPELLHFLEMHAFLDEDRSFGEGTVSMTLEDERAKINVNLASIPMLTGLFLAVGIPDGERMARSVVAWRNDTRFFMTIEELALVADMEAKWLAQLRPYLTLATPTTLISANSAPEPVLDAVVAQMIWHDQQQLLSSHPRQRPPPLDPVVVKAMILKGRPWTARRLLEDLGVRAGAFMVQSRIFTIRMRGTVRGRSCTLATAGDVIRLATGGEVTALWRKTYGSARM